MRRLNGGGMESSRREAGRGARVSGVVGTADVGPFILEADRREVRGYPGRIQDGFNLCVPELVMSTKVDGYADMLTKARCIEASGSS